MKRYDIKRPGITFLACAARIPLVDAYPEFVCSLGMYPQIVFLLRGILKFA
jgi:hypothetical protein